ncbi:MAG TPA: GH3 auxin-responsive promoter family protein, partial [Verrucomicrobiae bacterium]
PAVADAKTLSVVSPEVEELAPCGTPCGAESGHAYRSMPRAVAPMYSCPYETFEVKDYDSKYYTIVRIACGQPISMILTPNPSTVLLLAERMGQHTEEIIRDVRDGTLSARFNVADKIRQKLATVLKPEPERAAHLEKAASAGGGALLPRHVWPEQKIVACWKGGNVGAYLQKFERYFRPELPVRDLGYYASEVRGSVVLDDAGPDGALAIGTNVFEFFPADASGEPQGPDLLRADQLERGKRYFIYVTTSGGLYRYDMNDIIEVTGFYEGAPLIRFIQKGKGVVSFTGEKLYEVQVVAAVEQALAARKGHYEFITAVGELNGDQPQYSFLIEFEGPVSAKEAEALLQGIEKALCGQNAEYAAKRESGRIRRPMLRVIKTGEFQRYRQAEIQEGKRDSQFKTVRLTSDAALAKKFAVEREVIANAP